MKGNLYEHERFLFHQIEQWMEFYRKSLADTMPVIYEFIFEMTSGCKDTRNVIISDLKYYLEERQKLENEVNK